MAKLDIEKYKSLSHLTGRYAGQLARVKKSAQQTSCIEEAVNGVSSNLASPKNRSLVVYGDPQSGKTEMMIGLTAKLLDAGNKTIVHIMNDSVDLLSQNLRRFRASGLAPSVKNASELNVSPYDNANDELVVFCKKNTYDLDGLRKNLAKAKQIIVIDDEADYASPNGKINKGGKSEINKHIVGLIAKNGIYVGVTATPARLNLNKTFGNRAENWVHFPPHNAYTGQDTFFPLEMDTIKYRLKLLPATISKTDSSDALLRFIASCAFLNTHKNEVEQYYTMLVHTSGKKQDHHIDRSTIEETVKDLKNPTGKAFGILLTRLATITGELFPKADLDSVLTYVVQNVARTNVLVLNSERDCKAAGDNATEPTSPFTIIVGGNIVSRGVTFPNLLSMFFTRDVKTKIQQDTYIQRARMFGSRGAYLPYFELTIPTALFDDWHRCFVFHRLALKTIKSNLGSPVWLGDKRIAVASKPSIDSTNIILDKGEMSFGIFRLDKHCDEIVTKNQQSIATLVKLQKHLGDNAFPMFLLDYIKLMTKKKPVSLVIHTASPIGKSADVDQANVARPRGFFGRSQLEVLKYPNASHHIKIFYNKAGKARLFYKNSIGVTFSQMS